MSYESEVSDFLRKMEAGEGKTYPQNGLTAVEDYCRKLIESLDEIKNLANGSGSNGDKIRRIKEYFLRYPHKP